jgi:putative membrane-bound dehydrogenase-like protein
VPVNLALKKPTRVSSTQAGNDAKNAVDGVQGSRWCADGGSVPQWLEVDLGKPTHITGCHIDWEDRNAAYSYIVETSDDAKTWKQIVDHAHYKDSKSTHEFDATTRYVRVTCTGTLPGHWVSIWELSVFGDEKVKVDPLAAKAEADRGRMADVKVPEGFEATLFAAPPAVSYPTFVGAAADGAIYVSVDKNGSLDRQLKRGSVVRLRDIDGDGRADESKYFVADVDSPRGLVWDHDRLYLMHPPHLSAFIDHNGDGIADEQKVLVENIAFGFKDRPADHTSNGVTLGIDGWLYLAIGDFGFMEAEGTDGRKLQLRGGGVVRVRPDGTGLELYSNGTRNILEVAVDPLLNGFTRDNTNDGGGWDIRLHHFTGFEDHGYPRLYMNFRSEIIEPLADYGGGSGCGALFLDEPGFPKGFSPALYTADWGRSMVFRHQMTPNGATFAADQNEFFGLNRVTDLDVDANSTLYATSWKGATFTYNGEDVGSVIRLRPKGLNVDPLPNFEKATSSELVALLKSNSHRRRLEAQRTLLRRGIDTATAERIKVVMLDKTNTLPSRVAALFALRQANTFNRHANGMRVERAIDSKSPSAHADSIGVKQTIVAALGDDALRPYSIRAAADLWNDLDPSLLPLITSSAKTDARSKLELAVAIARFGDVAQAKAITPLLSDADLVVWHTAIQSLIKLKAGATCFEIVDQADASDASRAGALRALQGIHDPQVVDGLIARLGNETNTEKRHGLLIALCRLHFVDGEWKGNSWGTRPDTRGPYFQPDPWAETDKIAAVLQSELDKSDAAGTQFLAIQLARHRIELKGGLKTLLTKAQANPQFVPAVVGAIYRSGNFSLEALPLVSNAATSKESSAELRTQAIVALLKSSNADAFKAAIAALELTRNGSEGGSAEALNTFKDLATLNRHAKTLLAMSAGEASNQWIDGGTLLLAEDRKKNKKNANKDEAEDALAAAWAKPGRRLALLQAAEFFNTRTQEDLIRDGLNDSNKDVAAQAKKLADAWKISNSAPTGPKLITMKPEAILAAAMKMKGDAARGEGVYSKLTCNKCHTVKADEPIRGPYLPNVAKTYKREQLIESILLPSKTLAQGFVTNIFILNDGKSVVGFVTNEAAEEVTIRNAEGNELKIKVEDIDERAKQTISVMPEGLVKDLTLDDFAALIAYLESLASRATK